MKCKHLHTLEQLNYIRECERGFSTRARENELDIDNRISYETACMAVGLKETSVYNFPFVNFVWILKDIQIIVNTLL